MSLVFTPNAILEMAAISVSAMCEWRERCSRDEREYVNRSMVCKAVRGLRVCALNTAEKNGSLLMNFLHLKCQCDFLTQAFPPLQVVKYCAFTGTNGVTGNLRILYPSQVEQGRTGVLFRAIVPPTVSS